MNDGITACKISTPALNKIAMTCQCRDFPIELCCNTVLSFHLFFHYFLSLFVFKSVIVILVLKHCIHWLSKPQYISDNVESVQISKLFG